MPFTIEQYEALIANIAQLTSRVKFADKEVEYRPLEDLLRLKAAMEKDLGLTPRQIKTRFAKFSSGLNGNS